MVAPVSLSDSPLLLNLSTSSCSSADRPPGHTCHPLPAKGSGTPCRFCGSSVWVATSILVHAEEMPFRRVEIIVAKLLLRR